MLLATWTSALSRPEHQTSLLNQRVTKAIAFSMDRSLNKHVQFHLANLSEAVMFHRRVSPVQCRVSTFLYPEPNHRWHNSDGNVLALISVADDAPWPQALM